MVAVIAVGVLMRGVVKDEKETVREGVVVSIISGSGTHAQEWSTKVANGVVDTAPSVDRDGLRRRRLRLSRLWNCWDYCILRRTKPRIDEEQRPKQL